MSYADKVYYFNGLKDESLNNDKLMSMTVGELLLRAATSEGGQMIIVDEMEHMLLYLGVGLDSNELVEKSGALGFTD